MRLAPILVLLLVCGCSSTSGQKDNARSQNQTGSPVVACERLAFHAAIHDSQATLYLPGIAISLPRVSSASGERFAANGYVLWYKASGLTFRTPERSYSNCRQHNGDSTWAGAWLRGVDFRATGHEPGWILEMSKDQQLVLRWQYGKRQLATPVPEARREGDLFVYRGSHEGTPFSVAIMQRPCRDSMKGNTHDFAVRVRINDRELLGCGRGQMPVDTAP